MVLVIVIYRKGQLVETMNCSYLSAVSVAPFDIFEPIPRQEAPRSVLISPLYSKCMAASSV